MRKLPGVDAEALLSGLVTLSWYSSRTRWEQGSVAGGDAPVPADEAQAVDEQVDGRVDAVVDGESRGRAGRGRQPTG